MRVFLDCLDIKLIFLEIQLQQPHCVEVITYFSPPWDSKSYSLGTIAVSNLEKLSGLFLTIYCVRYPHTVPFLRNDMPYFLLKTPKIHAI